MDYTTRRRKNTTTEADKMKKRLSIKMAGHEYVAAFENTEKQGNQPDFKGDGIAVWVREYDENKPKQEPKKISITEESVL
jgi:hypothetical protein